MSMEARATRELALALVEEELSARRYAQGSRKAIRIALRDFFTWASKKGCANMFELGRKDLVRYHTALCAQVADRGIFRSRSRAGFAPIAPERYRQEYMSATA